MRLLLSLFLFSFSFSSQAINLGTHGVVYEILEEDTVVYIQRKLGEMEKTGKLEDLKKKHQEKVLNFIENPLPIAGLHTATNDRTFYYTPEFIQKENILDAKGKIIVAAGTRINALDYVKFQSLYIFIDARDKKQIEFAFKKRKEVPNSKIIVTAGSWIELTKKLGEQVYYDQFGYMTKKFKLSGMPSLVSREGRKVKIEELAL